jgi:hypothetical protein
VPYVFKIKYPLRFTVNRPFATINQQFYKILESWYCRKKEKYVENIYTKKNIKKAIRTKF